MRKSKVLISLLLCLMLSIGMFGTFASAEEDAITITVMMPHFGGIPTEKPVHQAWEKLMCEKLGVNINFEFSFVPWGEYSEKVNIALAANEFPDMMYLHSYTAATPYEDEDMFVDLSEYKDLIPNYLAYIDTVTNGMSKVSNEEGHMYGFYNGEKPRLTQGLGIYSCMAYRWDTFQENGIAIPETTDELLEAARKLKELYPDKYPVAYTDVWTYIYHTSSDIFWNGEAYEYGPISENYREGLSQV